jgi:hypothetical protein
MSTHEQSTFLHSFKFKNVAWLTDNGVEGVPHLGAHAVCRVSTRGGRV